MNNQEIVRRRLRNQRLTGPPLGSPAEVVSWLGAVQAQDYPGAKWALGQRLKGATDAALDQALADGSILRTHVLRPTWHFVAPADIHWMLALTAPRVNAISAYYFRQLELDAAVFRRSHAVLTKAMQGGRQRTRAELAAVLEKAGIATKTPLRLGYILMRAELDGVICSGAKRGKQFTYALLEERAPQAKAFQREAALAELVKRYFTSHGPATLPGFVWWSGLTTADARAGIEMAGPALARESIEGKSHWYAAAAVPAKVKSPAAYLLPNYDEYTINSQDRGPLLDPAHLEAMKTHDLRLFPHALLIDGFIVGMWRRTFEKEAIVVHTRLFAALTGAEHRAVNEATTRYSQFLGAPVVWQPAD